MSSCEAFVTTLPVSLLMSLLGPLTTLSQVVSVMSGQWGSLSAVDRPGSGIRSGRPVTDWLMASLVAELVGSLSDMVVTQFWPE